MAATWVTQRATPQLPIGARRASDPYGCHGGLNPKPSDPHGSHKGHWQLGHLAPVALMASIGVTGGLNPKPNDPHGSHRGHCELGRLAPVALMAAMRVTGFRV